MLRTRFVRASPFAVGNAANQLANVEKGPAYPPLRQLVFAHAPFPFSSSASTAFSSSTAASSSAIASVASSSGSGRSSASSSDSSFSHLKPSSLKSRSFDLGDRERCASGRPSSRAGFALGPAVGVGAVALLELGEVLGRERPVLLGDAGHVGAGVVDPDASRSGSPW